MTSRMRLAFFADPTETHTQRWARFFHERGHEVVFIVRHDQPGPPDGPDSLPMIRIGPPERPGRPARWVELVQRLRQAVREADPHIVHAHYLTTQGWMAWASGFRPYVITLWGSDIYLDLRGWKARAIGGLALRGASLVTADSNHLAAAAIRAGARSSRTEVIQFGVDLEVFAPRDASALRRRLAPHGGPIVFSPRTLMPLYRHGLVVAALGELPADVTMVFSARNAWPTAVRDIRQDASRLGLEGRIVIEPDIPHDRMPEYLNAADVVVSVPRSDATPVTLLEAMACGRPTVLADLPSLREWYAGTRHDLVVRNPETGGLARAIARALELSEAERSELAVRGRALVADRADHQRNMLEVEKRYRQLAGQG